MLRLFCILVFLSTSALAHEVQLITQHLKLNRQNESAWQSDLLAKAVLSTKLEVGLQGTYLERFDLYENRAGAFVVFHPTQSLTIQANYLHGKEGVEILPHDQYVISLYHALQPGISPYLTMKNTLYSVTHVQNISLGLEIEKISSIIILPQVMVGQAQFDNESKVQDIHNYGLKVIHYKEGHYSFAVFAYRGTEASQGIIGQSNLKIDTQSAGFGLGYFLTPDLKAEYTFDYTDYEQIKNQFLTSTLNLAWVF